MAARRAYNELLHLFKQHQLVTFATMSLEYDAVVYMAKAASQSRQSVNVSLMQHNNNICREALHQYQIAFPGVAQGEFTALELANLRECNRVMNVSRDMEPRDQQAYLRAVQARQQATQTMAMNRNRLVAQNDWPAYASVLRDLAKASNEEASTLNRKRTPYDNLISVHAFGMSYADVERVDFDLMTWWPAIRDSVRQRQRAAKSTLGPLKLPTIAVPTSDTDADEKSEKLFREVLQLVGFDWKRGRLDGGENPLTNPPPFDTRVVFRKNQRNPLMALTEAVHESGHAAVEQGVPSTFWFQPVGNTECKALHEGHSHWMEMFVLRNPDFAEVASSLLTDVYGADPAFEPSNLIRYFTTVELPEEKAALPVNVTSAIRDDLAMLPTIVLRTKLERELIEDVTPAKDIGARYADLSKQYLDVTMTAERAQRILMHDTLWGQGAFGYIPVYTYGVLYATQLQRAIVEELGTDAVKEALSSGVVRPLLGWLDTNVWSHGHLYETQKELVEAATKRPVTVDAWKAFVQHRFNT